jgi:hypothetical protein
MMRSSGTTSPDVPPPASPTHPEPRDRAGISPSWIRTSLAIVSTPMAASEYRRHGAESRGVARAASPGRLLGLQGRAGNPGAAMMEVVLAAFVAG